MIIIKFIVQNALSNQLLTILIFQVKSLPPLHIYVIDKALDGK